MSEAQEPRLLGRWPRVAHVTTGVRFASFLAPDEDVATAMPLGDGS